MTAPDPLTLRALDAARAALLECEDIQPLLLPPFLEYRGIVVGPGKEEFGDILALWWMKEKPDAEAIFSRVFPWAFLSYAQDVFVAPVSAAWAQEVLTRLPSLSFIPEGDNGALWAGTFRRATGASWRNWRGDRLSISKPGKFVTAVLESAFDAQGASGVYESLPFEQGDLRLGALDGRLATVPASLSPLLEWALRAPPFWWNPDEWPSPTQKGYKSLLISSAPEALKSAASGQPADAAVLLTGGVMFFVPTLPPPWGVLHFGNHIAAGVGSSVSPAPNAVWGDYWVWVVQLNDPALRVPWLIVDATNADHLLALKAGTRWYLLMLPLSEA